MRIDSKGKGRLTGMGVGLKDKKDSDQIWRMDYHSLHDDRNSSKDVRYIVDDPFHYHIERFPRK